jgi:hypothetical protein
MTKNPANPHGSVDATDQDHPVSFRERPLVKPEMREND